LESAQEQVQIHEERVRCAKLVLETAEGRLAQAKQVLEQVVASETAAQDTQMISSVAGLVMQDIPTAASKVIEALTPLVAKRALEIVQGLLQPQGLLQLNGSYMESDNLLRQLAAVTRVVGKNPSIQTASELLRVRIGKQAKAPTVSGLLLVQPPTWLPVAPPSPFMFWPHHPPQPPPHARSVAPALPRPSQPAAIMPPRPPPGSA